jgi:hypothetical protein
MYFGKASYSVPGFSNRLRKSALSRGLRFRWASPERDGRRRPSPHELIRPTYEFRRTFLVTKVVSGAGDKIAGTGAWPT